MHSAWTGRVSASTFRYHATRYEINVENPAGVCRGVVTAELDGVALAGNRRREIERGEIRPGSLWLTTAGPIV